jgi:hypothetical protein
MLHRIHTGASPDYAAQIKARAENTTEASDSYRGEERQAQTISQPINLKFL